MGCDDILSDSEVDPCTGFPTANKAKLSIPSIAWNKYGRNSVSFNSPPLSPVDQEIQSRMRPSCAIPCSQYIGLLLTIVSAITFSFNALIAKLLNHFHPFNLGVWTFQLMTLFAIPTLVYEVRVNKNKSLLQPLYPLTKTGNGKTVLFLWLRGIGGVSALIFFFYSVKYLTLADALVIDASSPIFVYIMAFLFLREKCGVVPVLATMMAFVGVAFITRPPILTGDSEYDVNSLIGAVLAFSCMLCITINIITLKFLQNVFHGIVNLVFGILGFIQCLFISIIFGALSFPTEASDILKILATAILFYAGQSLITLALKYEDASAVGLLRTTEALFAFVWQYLFLNVLPDIYSCIGALLILCGVVITITRKWISTLPSESRFRNHCNLLLY